MTAFGTLIGLTFGHRLGVHLGYGLSHPFERHFNTIGVCGVSVGAQVIVQVDPTVSNLQSFPFLPSGTAVMLKHRDRSKTQEADSGALSHFKSGPHLNAPIPIG